MKKILFIIIVSLACYGCLSDRGLISIKTIPPGATVYCNGIKIGEAPVEFEHDYHKLDNVTIEKEGFVTLKEAVGKKWVKKEAKTGKYEEGDFLVNGQRRHVWKVTTTRTLKKAQ